MPRNAATNLNTEAVCLPTLKENKKQTKAIKTTTQQKKLLNEKVTNTNHQKEFFVNVNKNNNGNKNNNNNKHDEHVVDVGAEIEEDDDDDSVEIIIPDLNIHPKTTTKTQARKLLIINNHINTLNKRNALKQQRILSDNSDDNDEKIHDHSINSPLYPAVIELVDSLNTLNPKSATTTTTAPSASARNSIEVPVALTLCTKLPAAAIVTTTSKKKTKAKQKQQKFSSSRDQSRLATLRTRKNSSSSHSSPEKAIEPQKKKALTVKKQQIAVPKTLTAVAAVTPSQPTVKEFDKIEVLEYDEAKAGGGSGGGTKRKRNNSLTSGVFGAVTALTATYPRKRVAAVKLQAGSNQNNNHSNQQQIHTVEQKGGGNSANSNTMSLYERRYETAASATSNDGSSRVGGGNNGYLSSTRSSSASSGVMHTSSDNGIINDVPMESQYYLSGGNAGAAANATTTISNGGNSVANVTNHAPSMATLCNIGNSCYLNSVVYTLRFAPRFLHNLHHLIVDLATVQQNIVRQRAKSASLGRGINATQLDSSARSWSSKDLASLEQYSTTATATATLHPGNVSALVGGSGGGGVDICKSRHQLLTEKLHELYQSLHRNEVNESTEPHHADKLLHAIQDVSTIFEGNQQQDAHEFLMCVLNSIRETCQTLIKMIAECPELIAEGNIVQHDELDSNDRTANGALSSAITTSSSVAPTINSSSSQSSATTQQSSSLVTKAWFTSRKSKRKDEAKIAKNFRLQSPLKDSAATNNVANSHFYLNSIDLSGGNTAGNTGAGNTATSPTTHCSPSLLKLNQLTNSASSDTSEVDSSQPLCKQRLAEKIRELGLDFFSEDFEGITVATTKCLSCETITEQKESMIDIAVPVSGYDSSDYTEKPSAFIQNSCITREYFRGENKYRCEQCTGYTEAIRSISYEVLPRLLVIQLSRFSGGMEKINSYIPTSFTLQCFCSKCCELSDANKLHVYKLYSVITHVGATMSVGHYIAYTCSLDWLNEYTNCPKDRRATLQQQQQQKQLQQQQPNGLVIQTSQSGHQSAHHQMSSAATAAASAITLSGTSLMKKMKFVRNKASSSGDISKNIKNLNGMTNAAAAAAASAAAATTNSQTITNGISKLSMNTTCHSLSCCATRLSTVQHQQQQQQQYGLNDLSEESMQNGANHNAAAAAATVVTSSSSSGVSLGSYSSGYGSTGRGGIKTTPFAANSQGNEPIWYMCDDDKIKAMTQREFEELLSPSRKITVTPYLLFYARFDLQPVKSSSSSGGGGGGVTSTQPTSASNQTTTPQSAQSSSSTMSWSNESLQTGVGGVGNPQKVV